MVKACFQELVVFSVGFLCFGPFALGVLLYRDISLVGFRGERMDSEGFGLVVTQQGV